MVVKTESDPSLLLFYASQILPQLPLRSDVKSGRSCEGHSLLIEDDKTSEPLLNKYELRPDGKESEMIQKKIFTKYCCFQLKTWTKLVGGIQILLSLTPVILLCYTYVAESMIEDHSCGRYKEGDEDRYDRCAYPRTNMGIQFQMFFSPVAVVSIFLGCILFAGAHHGKPNNISLWLNPYGIGISLTCLIFICLFLDFFFLGRDDPIVVLLTLLLLAVAMVYSVFLVSKYEKQLHLIKEEQLERTTTDFDTDMLCL